MDGEILTSEDLRAEYATQPCDFRVARWLDNHRLRNRIVRGIGEQAVIGFRVFAAGLVGLFGFVALFVMIGAMS